MTFHESPSIIVNGKSKAKKHYESSIKSGLSTTLRTPITILPQIPAKGYPITNPTYPSSHKKACGHEISKFGIKSYLKLEKIISKPPKTNCSAHMITKATSTYHPASRPSLSQK